MTKGASLSMADHLKSFTAVDVPLESVGTILSDYLRRFGPVAVHPLTGIREVLEFISPLKSFTTRFAAVGVANWTYVITNMKGATGYVEGLAVCRKAGGRTIAVSLLPERRELHIGEGGENLRRIQSLLDFDRWYFAEHGTPLPFEEPSDHSRPRRERLSVQLLPRYFEAFVGQSVPDWSRFLSNPSIGLERSISTLEVAVRSYEMSIDIP